jgi:CubicO group peptidase (beta-lactamase class C family)
MRSILIGMTFALAAWAAGNEEKRVDGIFEQYTKPGSPGCAVGVLRHGATVLAKGYGYADLDQSLPITPRSRFYMASVSKQFTSMALLMAEQDGKLKLDDSIRKYVPELPAYADGITIRRMLDHTAGFRDYLSLWGMRGFSNESVLKEEPTLALIARQKALNFAPGTDQNYSNTGYLLAAIALRRATGKPIETYVRRRSTNPSKCSPPASRPITATPSPTAPTATNSAAKPGKPSTSASTSSAAAACIPTSRTCSAGPATSKNR